VIQGQGAVVGVEGVLVEVVGELLAQREPRLAPVLVPRRGVAAEVVVVVPALEVLVGADHVVHLVPHVRAEDFSRDPGMVGDRHRLADVVAQRRHDHLVVHAGPLGSGGGLQGVDQLIDRKSADDLLQRGEQAKDSVGDQGLSLGALGADVGPLLGG
jgi:hypothetical protein